jgi:hypothetical protein
VSENALGILAQKFRIFLRTTKSSPENVDCIILAACVLHNFIRQRNDKFANQTNTITDEPSGTAQILNSLLLQGGRATHNTFAVREIFKDYFSSPVGSLVPSDNNMYTYLKINENKNSRHCFKIYDLCTKIKKK